MEKIDKTFNLTKLKRNQASKKKKNIYFLAKSIKINVTRYRVSTFFKKKNFTQLLPSYLFIPFIIKIFPFSSTLRETNARKKKKKKENIVSKLQKHERKPDQNFDRNNHNTEIYHVRSNRMMSRLSTHHF